jgi:Protein of unknown function (DUF1553)/Protein of unknown function (DUF1549)/Planctomycete cytochrome C/Concanavalin A-like lectin/glucanases superfamily
MNAIRCCLALLGSMVATSAFAKIDFANDIIPILRAHCYDCHAAKKQESGYRLDVRDSAFKGGDLGERAIEPGNATKSPLFRYANGDEPELFMPPKDSGKEPLSAEELITLKAWIDEGAVWPDELAGTLRPSHWSLQPLAKPTVPAITENPIDAFVRSKLTEKHLMPSSEADRRTLIRRLSFDLNGLPPSPSEIEAFVSDASPNAYESLVNRLLESKHYGERWARHWLDAARYTESQGFEYDRLRDNAWHYRDYVIKSFNEDKPYDQFMREQVAGDVMQPVTSDGIVATSLLVCGPYDQAGNNQKNATQRAITREDELEDVIGVVGQTFLGLTINCARCHAHKFDPIPHDEYYRVKSVFEGVKHGERSIASDEEKRAREEQLAVLRQAATAAADKVTQVESLGRELAAKKRTDEKVILGPAPYAQWSFDGEPSAVMAGTTVGGAEISGGGLKLNKEGAHFKSAPLTKDIREKSLEAWVSLANLEQAGGAAISLQTNAGQVFDAIVFGEQKARKWMAGSEGFVRTKDLDLPDETAASGTFVHVAMIYSSDNTITFYRNGEQLGKSYKPAAGLQTFKAGEAHVVLGMRHTGGGRPWLTGDVRQAALYDRALSPEEVLASYRSGGKALTQTEILACLTPEQHAARDRAMAEVNQAREALAALEKSSVAVSYAGVRVQPEPTKRLKRGEVNSPAEVVSPGALTAISNLDANFELAPDAPEAERRLKFAAWMVDKQNPLPARVMANRIWYQHFGQGIVSTPNDFGASGALPTHPELLDWLASSFIESGWSIKALHRLIVNSATYKQSSQFNANAAAIDADNQYLWRYAPRRLEAEAVRDAMLVASGQLNAQAGGPSFRPFTTTEFNATFYTPIDRDEPDFNRRTVYRINVNSGKDPLLDSFDCPDPSVKTPRRGVTTTPLQALELMNNAFVQRMSRRLAERASRESNDIGGAVEYAYKLTLGRRPNTEEAARAIAAAKERGLNSVCWALLNSTEFIYVR